MTNKSTSEDKELIGSRNPISLRFGDLQKRYLLRPFQQSMDFIDNFQVRMMHVWLFQNRGMQKAVVVYLIASFL